MRVFSFARGAASSFLADVERQLEEVPLEQRSAAAERFALTRTMIGPAKALRRFLGWKTPEELYPDSNGE